MNFFLGTLKMALRSLLAKKLRSLLSILGIVIGILTVSGLLTLALGVKKEITNSIEGLGANLVAVLPGKVDNTGGINFAAQLGASTLTQQDFAAINENIPEAQNLSMAMLVAGTAKGEGRELPSALIFAATPRIEQVLNLKVKTGRFLDEADEVTRGRVIVLGSQAAAFLFGDQNPIPKNVELRGETFGVIGVLEEVPSGVNIGGPDFNSVLIIPIQTGWEITGTKQIFRIMMQAPDAESVETIKGKIRDTLLATHNGEEDFSVFSQDDILDLVGRILNVVTSMLSAIAAISLVVGGIGIMNIMLVSVSERTREIGIRKAVGATRRDIMLQFLVESIILTVVGGLVAVAIYATAIKIAQGRSPIPLEINPLILLLSLVFAVVVGVIFGLLPALTASRKDPITALRYE